MGANFSKPISSVFVWWFRVLQSFSSIKFFFLAGEVACTYIFLKRNSDERRERHVVMGCCSSWLVPAHSAAGWASLRRCGTMWTSWNGFYSQDNMLMSTFSETLSCRFIWRFRIPRPFSSRTPAPQIHDHATTSEKNQRRKERGWCMRKLLQVNFAYFR